MGSYDVDELPRVDSIDPGVLADLQHLILWQCRVGSAQRPVRIGQPLTAALDGCGYLLDALALSPEEALNRLNEVLPNHLDSQSAVSTRLYAVRAMLGLLEARPTYETFALGSEGLRLGNVETHPGTVESRGFSWDKNVEMRKAFVAELFGVSSPSAIKLDRPAAVQMARALALALGLVDNAQRDNRMVGGTKRTLLSSQFALRLDEAPLHYPSHLTTTALAAGLTLSPFEREVDEHPQDRRGLYARVHSSGGTSAEHVLADNRRVVVLGNPGGGKSTVLAAAVVARASRNVPAIVVRLSTLAERLDRPFTIGELTQLLVEIAAADAMIPADPAAQVGLARRLASDSDALVGMDGLDEVHPQFIDRVHGALRQLDGLPGSVLISARSVGYVTPPGKWAEYQVDALTPGAAREFLDRWFGAGQQVARTRAEAALSSRRRAELTGVPVLLGIIATVASESTVPDSEAVLYDYYVSMFLRGKWKPSGLWVPVEEIPTRLAIAREVAWAMATGLTGRADGARWQDTIAFADLISPANTSDPSLAKLLVERHGLFVAHGLSRSELHQRFRWLHRTVHEHLVGAYLAERVRVAGDEVGFLDDLLLGPYHWVTPLGQMMDLLGDEGQGRVMKRLAALHAEGDPGEKLIALMALLGSALPEGSRLRRELALQALDSGDYQAATALDYAMWLEELPIRAREGSLWNVPHALQSGVHLGEAYLRELLDCQQDTWRLTPQLYYDTAVALSRFAPDRALEALVDVAPLTWDEASIEADWLQQPSPEAVGRTLRQIETWEAGDRLRMLHLLVDCGVDLRNHLRPTGPSESRDIQAAYELAHPPEEAVRDDGRRLHSYDVVQWLVSGRYGDEYAFRFGGRYDLRSFSRTTVSESALLATEIRKVARLTVGSAPGKLPADSVELLTSVTVEDVTSVQTARRLVAAVADCIENGQLVPPEWAVETYVATGAIEDELRGREKRGLIPRAVLTAIRTSLWQIASLHPEVVRRIVLEVTAARPAEEVHEYFTLVRKLDESGVLTDDDLVELACRAAPTGIRVLNAKKLGALADDVAEILASRCPEALATEASTLARALAEVGQFRKWRSPILAALAQRSAS